MRYDIDISHVKSMHAGIWGMIKSTFSLRTGMGRPLPIYGHYGGVFEIGKEKIVIHTDGVGTKLLVAQELGKCDTVGIDAIAMSANDILCLGAETLNGVDYIALAKEDEALVHDLMKGLVQGARECDCVILGGETAIVPDLLKSEKCFDLTFTAIGRIVTKEPITGKDVTEGDVMIGLHSSGIHSNGYTLARKALDIKKWGNEMLIPTRIYVKPVVEVLKRHVVHGIAHITGGAYTKITRLNSAVGYEFTSLPKPPAIFDAIAKSGVDEREMYKTFNMGIGLVIIVPKGEETAVMATLKKHGETPVVVGRITKTPGVRITINGKMISLV